MKVLSIIFSFLLTIVMLVQTMWEVSIESPIFVVCMFFVMCFMAFAILCKCFADLYEKNK